MGNLTGASRRSKRRRPSGACRFTESQTNTTSVAPFPASRGTGASRWMAGCPERLSRASGRPNPLHIPECPSGAGYAAASATDDDRQGAGGSVGFTNVTLRRRPRATSASERNRSESGPSALQIVEQPAVHQEEHHGQKDEDRELDDQAAAVGMGVVTANKAQTERTSSAAGQRRSAARELPRLVAASRLRNVAVARTPTRRP